jgi:phosphatidylglycerophosphate synthase
MQEDLRSIPSVSATDGERWTAYELEHLRRGHFRPSAWRRFLARTFERARAERRVRPQAHRQVVLAAIVAAAAWTVAAVLWEPVPAAAGAAWSIGVALMADWHLGMLDGQRRLGAATVVTLGRGALVPVLAFVPPTAIALLYAAARASDLVDGRLARARGESTRLGAWLDGSVDALLLAAAAGAALAHGALTVPAAAAALGRALLPAVAIAGAAFVRAEVPRPRRLPGSVAAAAVLDAGLVLALLGAGTGSVIVLAGVGLGVAALAPAVSRRRPSGSSS